MHFNSNFSNIAVSSRSICEHLDCSAIDVVDGTCTSCSDATTCTEVSCDAGFFKTGTACLDTVYESTQLCGGPEPSCTFDAARAACELACQRLFRSPTPTLPLVTCFCLACPDHLNPNGSLFLLEARCASATAQAGMRLCPKAALLTHHHCAWGWVAERVIALWVQEQDPACGAEAGYNENPASTLANAHCCSDVDSGGDEDRVCTDLELSEEQYGSGASCRDAGQQNRSSVPPTHRLTPPALPPTGCLQTLHFSTRSCRRSHSQGDSMRSDGWTRIPRSPQCHLWRRPGDCRLCCCSSPMLRRHHALLLYLHRRF